MHRERSMVADLLSLLSLLRACDDGLLISDAAARLGITRQAVRDHVRLLQMCGRPPMGPGDFVDVEMSHGRIRLHHDQGLGTAVQLSADEICALDLALRSVQEGQLEPYATAAASARSRLGMAPGSPSVTAPASPGGGGTPESAALLAVLALGQHRRREIAIRFFSDENGKMRTTVFRPYLLFHHVGCWYVVGACGREADETVLSLSDIERARLTERPFSIPADFRATQYLEPTVFSRRDADAIRTAWVKFKAPLGPLIVDDWFPDQFARAAGGWLEGPHAYPDAGTLLALVRRYGGQAELVAPAHLRKRLASDLRIALANYDAA